MLATKLGAGASALVAGLLGSACAGRIVSAGFLARGGYGGLEARPLRRELHLEVARRLRLRRRKVRRQCVVLGTQLALALCEAPLERRVGRRRARRQLVALLRTCGAWRMCGRGMASTSAMQTTDYTDAHERSRRGTNLRQGSLGLGDSGGGALLGLAGAGVGGQACIGLSALAALLVCSRAIRPGWTRRWINTRECALASHRGKHARRGE